MQLDIQHLQQNYAQAKPALNDINLTLHSGIIGLLGPNGAGKSSLMRILATLSQPSAGNVLWNGVDVLRKPAVLRRELGYLPQSFGVYDNLSAWEFLHYLAGLKGLTNQQAKTKINELLHMLNLADVAKQPLGSFSGGMKQRVGIAQALLNDPKLLIVDEPTVGLDPQERARFRDLLSDMSGDRIIILSTHIVSDVESIADNIAMLREGELLAYAKPESLLAGLRHAVWQCTVPKVQVAAMAQQFCISQSVRQADGMQLRIVSHESPCAGAKNIPPTLEDVFLYYCQSSQSESVTHAQEVAA
ncbi:MAG: ABC transporter ATP-binding protein [Paraglaciecola sp.]|nr:ABC transporter ATP-binding protein [Paraglaciecola sp.]